MEREIPIPRYYQIVHLLEKRFHDNHYAPGERFPSEKELGLTFGVSRITARRVLEEMVKLGLVTRRQGKGTYVAMNFERPDFPKFTGLIDSLFMIGRGGVVKKASVEEVLAPPKVRAALQLTGSDASTTRIQRVLLVHDRPYAYHENFYPVSIGKKIQTPDLMKYPLLEILEKKLHIPVIEVRQVIEAVVADTEVAERLEVSFGSPLFYVERLLLGEKGTPIGFTQAYHRGDGYRLSVTLVKGEGNSAKGWRWSA